MSRIMDIKHFIVEQFAPDLKADDVGDDYDLLDGAVIDSLGLLKLIAWLETHFGVDSDLLELEPGNFRTVTAIDASVERALSAVG
ncbi:MAG: acyl carrier protein [Nonomuraea sp.]|nr:acyl carrier protein [Nonomuraea sp.]